MPWIRLDTDFFDDEKILDIGLDRAIVFIAILTIIKVSGSGGRLRASKLSDTSIRHRLGLPRNAGDVTLRYAGSVDALVDVGLLERSDDGLFISATNWGRYQRDPKNAERQARYRARSEARVTSRNARNAPTVCNTVGGESAKAPSPDPILRTWDEHRARDEARPAGEME